MRRACSHPFFLSGENGERGSMMIFFGAVILPILFVLFTVSVDFTRYYTERDRAQKVLDDAALYAYRFLPDSTRATQAARDFMARRSDLASAVLVEATPDFVAMEIRTAVPIYFAQLLGVDRSLPLNVYSRVRGTPFDVMLAMDVGRFVSPDLPAGSAWGDPTNWPAASFFESIANDESTPERERLITQQCFNPLLSELKRATINIYREVASFPSNNVGVGFFPGNGMSYDVVRRLNGGGLAGASTASFGVPYASIYVKDSECAAAALEEQAATGYRFPAYCGNNTDGVSIVIPGGQRFNSAYNNYLLAEEVIWSRAANKDTPLETDLLLTGLLAELFSGGQNQNREKLVNRAFKKAIIISANLPVAAGQTYPNPDAQGALSTAIEKVRNAVIAARSKLKVYYVVLSDPAYGNLVSLGQARALQEFFDGEESLGGIVDASLDFQVLYGDSAEALRAKIVDALILDKRSGLVSK